MNDRDQVYLKQNLVVEPLFNQWYAWPYLISPTTAGMYIANSHLKIMHSFVTAPQVHVSAIKNPAMLGGPFVNYGSSRINEMKELMERTTKENAHMLEFAEAVKSLDQLLTVEATGFSMETIYPRVPDILKGYVELTYDLNNNPSFRFIEGLLYKSRYYNAGAQSVSLSLVDANDSRSFVFSTPRLNSADQLQLKLPFNAKELDMLFETKQSLQSLGAIKERLNIQACDNELFESFFTAQLPLRRPYQQHGVHVRYLGHACVLIESEDVVILTDPVISYLHNNDIPQVTFADLPAKIDYVLITHNHQDHCMFETLLQLRHKIDTIIVPKSGGTFADPSLKLILQHTGFSNVREIDELEMIKLPDGSIIGLPFLGEHADLNIRTKIAFLVTLKEKKIMLVADSNNLEPRLYDHLYHCIGNIDLLFIGMECDGAPMSWLYGPLLTKPLSRKMDQSRRFDGSNYSKGIDIVNKFQPSQVYVYAMGQEPWLTFLTSIKYTDESHPIVESNLLVADCQRRGIIAERPLGCKDIYLA